MKKWFEPMTTAWVGVVTHKLRSFLTILGIVIGVAAVITLMSIGRGATAQILSNIESMGSNLMLVRPGGGSSFGGVRGASGSGQTLTQEDAAAIAELPYISAVAPYSSRSLQLVYGSRNMNAQVTGTTPEYQQIQNLSLTSGAFFTEYDYQRGARLAVLGANVKDTLFGDADPVGRELHMGSIIVRVIGVLETKGGLQSSIDDGITIPLSALQQTVAQPRTAQGGRVVSTIALTVTDTSRTQTVISEITSLLRTRHQLGASAADDFSIVSMEEIAGTLSEATGTMTLLLGAIAAISLLVGGIGVMNIMLVSVLERTREIGIRKALGARERDIWGQFIIEAAFLTLAGGIIGVIAGWTVSYIISRLGVINTLVSADIVILSVSVSVGIGLFFGFYPAWNAARLNPIEALRSE